MDSDIDSRLLPQCRVSAQSPVDAVNLAVRFADNPVVGVDPSLVRLFSATCMPVFGFPDPLQRARNFRF